jgi:hypothetical protein
MVISDGISGYSKEQKILGIPFRTLPRKRKQLRIPFRGTKIEANSRDSLPNPLVEEKHLGIPFRGTTVQAISQNSVPNHSAEAVLRIHDILGWIRIRIRGSMPLTDGSGSGSGSWIRILLFSSLTFKMPGKN